jgi:Flp pilus assembly protein TadG
MTKMKSHIGRFLRSRAGDLARDDEGVVLVDVAFAFIVLSLFLIGIADLGNAYMRQMTLTNAVRAGSQLALVRTPSLDVSADSEEAITSISEIRAAVLNAAPFLESDPGQDYLSVSLDCSCSDGTATVCYTDPDTGSGPSCPEPRAYVTVALTYDHQFLFDYPPLDDGLTLRAENSVRVR